MLRICLFDELLLLCVMLPLLLFGLLE